MYNPGDMDATKIGSIEREQMRDLAEKKSEETLLGKTINASRAIAIVL